MAEKRAESAATPGRYTTIWMVSALVLVGAFLGWLAWKSEPSKVAVVEEETEESGADIVMTVPLDQFAASVAQYEGQTVRLADIRAESRMGEQAFWIQLPTGVPYLIKLDTALVSEGFAVQSGDVLSVVGPVRLMTDSVIASWQERGAIQNEGHEAEARFATHFLEAQRARLQPRSEDAGS